MELLDKVGRYEFLAEPFHCDFSHKLFIGHLSNHMLNAADFHSNDRGYGMSYLNPRHKTWVLSRLAIEMNDMPMVYDSFFVETWVDDVMKYFTSRNFSIIDSKGCKVYGYGRSIWAMIDTDTRQPTDILALHDGLITQYVDIEKPCPITKPSRVKMYEKAHLARELNIFYSDIDVNGHVNSVKYIEHVLDLFAPEMYESHFLKRFEIAYVAETYYSDRLLFYSDEQSPGEFYIRIVKQTEANRDFVEVARCMAKFVERA